MYILLHAPYLPDLTPGDFALFLAPRKSSRTSALMSFRRQLKLYCTVKVQTGCVVLSRHGLGGIAIVQKLAVNILRKNDI